MLFPATIAQLALALLVLAAAPPAGARVEAGATLEAVQLPTVAGGLEPLVSPKAVNVILFWRPDQERSLDTLGQLGQCEAAFAGKPVRTVSVVSGSYPPAAVKAAAEAAALRGPVLVDGGDVLYGKLEIAQHPLVLVTDAKGKIALSQPYMKIRYCALLTAHVRYLLKEIDAAQLAAVLQPERAAFPGDDKRNVARRYVKMGLMEVEAGHCDQAVRSFRSALEIVPDDPGALAGLARCEAAAPQAAVRR